MKTTRRLEVHSHSYVSGRRANGGCYGKDGVWLSSTFSHSHEGGDQPHQHDDTGPATYMIDKDDWARATGLLGGGRKKFTATPVGDQLPIRALEDWQKSFEVIIVGPPQPEIGEGPGLGPAARMMLGFRMKARLRDRRKKKGGAR